MDYHEFDTFASNYRAIHTENIQNVSGKSSDYFSEYKVKELYKFFDKNDDLNFLDFGCGDGNTAKYIEHYFCNFKYVGIDVSNDSLNIAKNRCLHNCEFELYDGKHIPYDNNTFDVVFMACVMHHIDERQRVMMLEEIKRVLKVNGKLVIFEHNPYNPITCKLVKDCVFDEDAILISANNLKHILNKAGFLEKKIIKYTIFFPRKSIFNKCLSLESKLYWCPLGGQYYCIVEKK